MDLLLPVIWSIAPLIVNLCCLYLWAGACFLFYRYYRPETEARMRRFLEDYHKFFVNNLSSSSPSSAISRHEIQSTGVGGWSFFFMASLTLWHEFSWLMLACIVLLFFGGLKFAISWYGMRCLRLLGLEAYTKGISVVEGGAG